MRDAMPYQEAARLANDALEPFLKQFGTPIVEWLARRTGEDQAWIGAHILTTAAAGMLAWMLMDEQNDDERKRYAGLIAQHFDQEMHRMLAKRDELLQGVMSEDQERGA